MALVTLNCTAHNKPVLIRDHMDEILPNLYKETTIKVCPAIYYYYLLSVIGHHDHGRVKHGWLCFYLNSDVTNC